MRSPAITLLEAYCGGLDEDAPIEAAIARLPAPRPPDILLAKLVALGVAPGDLSPRYVDETRSGMGEAESARVHLARAVAEALPLRRQSVDFIWCRDMLYHVDLPRTLRECAAVLVPGGLMVVYQSFATELLELLESQRLYWPTIIAENMDPSYFETCAMAAGFAVVEHDKIGSEWRESAEGGGTSRNTSGGIRSRPLRLSSSADY